MYHFEQTSENCREFLRSHPLVESAFENLGVSSCRGYEFTLKNGFSVKLRLDARIDYAIMELFPGIQARESHLNLVADYCLQAMRFPSPTYFAVSPGQGDIYHHSEQSFRDAPIPAGIFSCMLDRAVREMQAHFPIFQDLAYGRLPELKQLARLEAEKAGAVYAPSAAECRCQEAARRAIRKYLEACGHNVVGVSLAEQDGAAFFTETMTHTDRYRSYYSFREGYLLHVVRVDIRPDAALRSQVAAYINRETSDKKVCHLALDDDGCLCAVTSHYLLPSADALSSGMLEQMEGIVIASIHHAGRALRKILSGEAAETRSEARRAVQEEDEDEEEPGFDWASALELDDDEDEPDIPPRPASDRLHELELELDDLLSRICCPEKDSAGEIDEDSLIIPDPTGMEEEDN